MAFCIIMGTHEFSGPLDGYQGVTAQCHNCGNWSAQCISRWPWFTVCWVPVIPLSTHKYQEVACPICHFMEDLRNRPDVQSQHPSAGGGGGGGGGPPPQGYGGPNQGYGVPNQGYQGQQGGGGGGGQRPQYK